MSTQGLHSSVGSTKVWGIPLSVAARRSDPGRALIPDLVLTPLAWLDKHKVPAVAWCEGSADEQRIAELKARFDQGLRVVLPADEPPGVLTTLVLRFLAAVPNGVIPSEAIRQIESARDSPVGIKAVLQSLPPAHVATLILLFNHLHVAQQRTGVEAQELASVVACVLVKDAPMQAIPHIISAFTLMIESSDIILPLSTLSILQLGYRPTEQQASAPTPKLLLSQEGKLSTCQNEIGLHQSHRSHESETPALESSGLGVMDAHELQTEGDNSWTRVAAETRSRIERLKDIIQDSKWAVASQPTSTHPSSAIPVDGDITISEWLCSLQQRSQNLADDLKTIIAPTLQPKDLTS